MKGRRYRLARTAVLALFLALASPACHRVGPARPPSPSGPSSVQTGFICHFTATTTDSDGDSLQYQFDWDDGQMSRWTSPIASGETLVWSHGWTAPGTYLVRVHALNTKQLTSPWSPAHRIVITTE